MKTVTVVAWKRPTYLLQVVDGLRQNNVTGYSFVAVLDHGFDPVCKAILDAVDFLPKRILELPRHSGADHANRVAYEAALHSGSKLNVAFEDDTVPSPDCLDLVNWWETEVGTGVLCLHSYSRDPRTSPNRLFSSPNLEFNGWGWAVRSSGMTPILKEWTRHAPGWDNSTRLTLRRGHANITQPELSRTLNIGRDGGTHYTPELFDAHFGGVISAPKFFETPKYVIA
jgi:hypothetical protein